jgi:hypothetical protein
LALTKHERHWRSNCPNWIRTESSSGLDGADRGYLDFAICQQDAISQSALFSATARLFALLMQDAVTRHGQMGGDGTGLEKAKAFSD